MWIQDAIDEYGIKNLRIFAEIPGYQHRVEHTILDDCTPPLPDGEFWLEANPLCGLFEVDRYTAEQINVLLFRNKASIYVLVDEDNKYQKLPHGSKSLY